MKTNWFILSNQNGSEISRHRTLLRAVEAQEAFGHASTISGTQPIDIQDLMIASEILETARERQGFKLYELRNYHHGMRLGTYSSRTGAEAALAEQVALDPANRINCGVEVVRQEVGR
jgi:hypothetical protein